MSGIVAVSPGEGGVGTLVSPHDREGNTVKGQLVAMSLSALLGLGPGDLAAGRTMNVRMRVALITGAMSETPQKAPS